MIYISKLYIVKIIHHPKQINMSWQSYKTFLRNPKSINIFAICEVGNIL